jgi:hypothetical protein
MRHGVAFRNGLPIIIAGLRESPILGAGKAEFFAFFEAPTHRPGRREGAADSQNPRRDA